MRGVWNTFAAALSAARRRHHPVGVVQRSLLRAQAKIERSFAETGTNEKLLSSELWSRLVYTSNIYIPTCSFTICQMYPESNGSVSVRHNDVIRELKMQDFLDRAVCLQLLCAGEKINIRGSKVILVKYNENVRKLLGVESVAMRMWTSNSDQYIINIKWKNTR